MADGVARRPHGLGAGWRPELAKVLADRAAAGRLDFVEVIAEHVTLRGPVPPLLAELDVPVLVHGTRLSLGTPGGLEPRRLARLAAVAAHLDAPLVSEHVAFVRAGGLEAGHLLPLPRSRDAVDVTVRNIRSAAAELPVPMAVENPAALLSWPDDEMAPADFLTEIAERSGAMLLVDLANLYGDVVNHGVDAITFLDRLPWERVAYLHVAGGYRQRSAGLHTGGRGAVVYHDTHRHPVLPEVFDLVREAAARSQVVAVMLERDGAFPAAAESHAELDAVEAACAGAGAPGTVRRRASCDLRDLAVLRPPGTTRQDPERAARLAARQHDLVAALVAGGAPPRDLDAGQVAATRAGLVAKRRAALAWHWPDLAGVAGFVERFTDYALTHPPAGTTADALAFAAEVADELTDEARVEVLAAQVASGGPAVRITRRRGRRTLVAARVPGLGVRLVRGVRRQRRRRRW